MGIYQTLHQWISIVICFLIGVCVAPRGGAPPDLPTLSTQHIQQDYAQMSPEVQRLHIQTLLAYRDHLDRYLDVVYQVVFHRPYLTTEEWLRHCHPSQYFREITIPKKPNLKDDGTHTDSEIILQLVQRINMLVNNMRHHNEDFRTALNRFNKTCAHAEALCQ